MKNDSLALLILLLLIPIAVAFIDLPFTYTVAALWSSEWKFIFFRTSKLGGGEIWTLLGLFLLFRNWKPKIPWKSFISAKESLFAIYFLSSLAISGVASNSLKYLIGRPRPTAYMESGRLFLEPLQFLPKADSFPSGHTTTVWTVMLALSLRYPRYRLAFVLLAMLGSFSRVMLQRHYVSDVIGGALLAVIVLLVTRLILIKIFHEFQIIPEILGFSSAQVAESRGRPKQMAEVLIEKDCP